MARKRTRFEDESFTIDHAGMTHNGEGSVGLA
jgi:hypothetical protein